jgi:hypothetical protein
MKAKKSMHYVGVFALLAFLLLPYEGQAAEVLVQALGTAGNANAGDSGAAISSSAIISVLVTSKGKPVSNLGESVGDGTYEISLPTGWGLDFRIVAPGGCSVSVTAFNNWGDGLYSIRIVPYLGTPACAWKSGDYHYVIQILTSKYSGMSLVSLTIP